MRVRVYDLDNATATVGDDDFLGQVEASLGSVSLFFVFCYECTCSNCALCLMLLLLLKHIFNSNYTHVYCKVYIPLHSIVLSEYFKFLVAAAVEELVNVMYTC